MLIKKKRKALSFLVIYEHPKALKPWCVHGGSGGMPIPLLPAEHFPTRIHQQT